MTAALFDVKAKFSEYVTIAEKGEVVEITKHGRTSAVIISVDEYNRLKREYKPSFIDQVNKWKRKTGGISEIDAMEFEKALSRDKELYSTGGVF